MYNFQWLKTAKNEEIIFFILSAETRNDRKALKGIKWMLREDFK